MTKGAGPTIKAVESAKARHVDLLAAAAVDVAADVDERPVALCGEAHVVLALGLAERAGLAVFAKELLAKKMCVGSLRGHSQNRICLPSSVAS